MYNIEGYLTQKKLGDFLRHYLEERGVLETLETEKRVPDTRRRWDFYYELDGKRIVVEFDGDRHYCNSMTIMSDHIKNQIAEYNCIETIRIPYFIQLNSQTFEYYFGEKYGIETDFAHGFITTKVFPASFCTLGLKRYESEMASLPDNITGDVKSSLKEQCDKLGEMYVMA